MTQTTPPPTPEFHTTARLSKSQRDLLTLLCTGYFVSESVDGNYTTLRTGAGAAVRDIDRRPIDKLVDLGLADYTFKAGRRCFEATLAGFNRVRIPVPLRDKRCVWCGVQLPVEMDYTERFCNEDCSAEWFQAHPEDEPNADENL